MSDKENLLPKSALDIERQKGKKASERISRVDKFQDFLTKVHNIGIVPGAGIAVEGVRLVKSFLKNYYPTDVKLSKETERVANGSFMLLAEIEKKTDEGKFPVDKFRDVSKTAREMIELLDNFNTLTKSQKLKLLEFYELKLNTLALDIDNIVNEVVLSR
jgi:hypothetical protein